MHSFWLLLFISTYFEKHLRMAASVSGTCPIFSYRKAVLKISEHFRKIFNTFRNTSKLGSFFTYVADVAFCKLKMSNFPFYLTSIIS